MFGGTVLMHLHAGDCPFLLCVLAPTISSVSLATCGDTARRCWYPTVVVILARSGP